MANGTNNFVQNGKPLGWYRGSDGQEIIIGINYFNNNNLISNISTGLSRVVKKLLLIEYLNPIQIILKVLFLVGRCKKTYYIKTILLICSKKLFNIKFFIYLKKI